MNNKITEEMLTAYALGELPPDEARLVETHLAADPAAADFVRQVRAMGLELKQAMAAEGGALKPTQKKAIELKMRHPAVPAPGRVLRLWAPLAAAACIAVLAIAGLAGLFTHQASLTDVALVNERPVAPSPVAQPVVGGPEPLGEGRAGHRDRSGGSYDQKKEAEAGRLQETPKAKDDNAQLRNDLALGPDPTGAVSSDGGKGAAESGPPRLALAVPTPAPAMPSTPPGVGGGAGGGASSALRQASAIYGADQAPAGKPAQFGQGGNGIPSGGKVPPGKAGDGKAAGWGATEGAGNGDLRDRREEGKPADAESYPFYGENNFCLTADQTISTFGADVDTASYSNVRRFLTQQHQLPPADAVRVEEMINYFHYNYPAPDAKSEHPFAASMEVAGCPWAPTHRLVRIGLRAREVKANARPATNLVFLLDVSGSMGEANKLPLAKKAMSMLVDRLDERDKVSIVTYAGESGVALKPTEAHARQTILAAIDKLSAGGSTNGGSGIQLAYQTAAEGFIEGGINRVILCTDGDFNVGTTGQNDLVNMIQAKAKTGTFLSVFGFGMGNLKDATLQKLADKGNGHYGYIDTEAEAKKLLVDEMMSTLMTVAKDVKIQVEFNPAKVQAYRLIGYEKRALMAHEFDDDTKDAGEMGAGHAVTALYEVIPAKAAPATMPAMAAGARPANAGNQMLSLRLRYKQPQSDTSVLMTSTLADDGKSFEKATDDFRWATAVAAFGMSLRDSRFGGSYTMDAVSELAGSLKLDDPKRKELVEMAKTAGELTQAAKTAK